jgi:hypothetical protein
MVTVPISYTRSLTHPEFSSQLRRRRGGGIRRRGGDRDRGEFEEKERKGNLVRL